MIENVENELKNVIFRSLFWTEFAGKMREMESNSSASGAFVADAENRDAENLSLIASAKALVEPNEKQFELIIERIKVITNYKFLSNVNLKI